MKRLIIYVAICGIDECRLYNSGIWGKISTEKCRKSNAWQYINHSYIENYWNDKFTSFTYQEQINDALTNFLSYLFINIIKNYYLTIDLLNSTANYLSHLSRSKT